MRKEALLIIDVQNDTLKMDGVNCTNRKKR